MSEARRLVLAGFTAFIAMSAIAVLTPASPPAKATDHQAVFDPLPNAQSQGPAVYGHVATDGDGIFYAVHRTATPVGQFIAVRKSLDGGRSWVTVQMLQGSAGGGTRPQLAVWDSFVAVAFVGAWCDPQSPSSCSEAPYLAVSENGGASWSGPRRLDQQAFDVYVAQDSDRTWVAWERGGSMELRMTTDGGATWAVERRIDRAVTGQLAASDGAAVFTYFVNASGPDDNPSTWALVADLDTLATTATPIDPGPGWEVAYPLAAAAAGGRVHVVTRTGLKNTTDPAQQIVQVHSADADGSFADVVSFDGDPWSASIAANRGTLALAVGDRGGETAVATSTDGGATFSDLVPVTVSTDGNAPIVGLGLARLPADKPVARYSWSVPERYVDDDGDGFVDPANDTGQDSADALRVFAGRTLTVTIDACDSVAPENRTITAFKWTELLEGGGTEVLPLTSCRGDLRFDDGQRMTLRLDVTDSAGQRSSTVQTVEPRDYLIASLGDSVASGEGNPHVDSSADSPAIWQDRPCHRSVDAGPSVAAARLEAADPHSSVTFIQLACSGASVLDSPEVAGTDDPKSGGVIDEYQGQRPEPGSLRASQVSQLDELLGNRSVDSLLMSIGANDVRFSDTLTLCIVEPSCDTSSTRTEFEQRLTTLPSRYARLDAALTGIGVESGAVHVTEYFDPSVDERGVTQMRCAVAGGVFDLLDDDEARWASTGVTGGINSAVTAAASSYGWKLVGGLAGAFRGHGYCSSDPWIVRLGESLNRQGNKDGSFHPNALGHAAYAQAIYRSLRSDLLVPPPAMPSAPAAGAEALGDMMVLSATTNAITVTALRDTGGAPAIVGSRLIDRVVSGPGGLGISGPPAVSRTAAVGSWTQLPALGTTATEQQLAQLAVKPNVAVLTVEVMQAPRNERQLVADRDTVVVAILDATIEQPTTVTVDVQASVLPLDPDDPNSPPGRPLVAASESVQLVPGLNRVILPTSQTFELFDGEEPTATVTVQDPEGADPADDIDNELTTDPNRSKIAVETRPLTVQMMTSPIPSGDIVSCANLSGIARKQTAFAREALPVAGPRILAMLSCADFPPFLDSTENALIAYINMLDLLARQTLVDVMVSVVPDGWLQSVTGGAVGVAVPGRRAVIIEASAPKMVLAHEIAHSFGIEEHVAGTPTVTGVDVTRRALVTGVDYMAERTPERSWTGPATWDSLVTRIGPPGGVPAPPAPLGNDFEFGGTVGSDGTFDAADPVRGNTGSPRPTNSGANLTRMVLEQTSGDTLITSQPVPLEEIGGMFAPGSGPTAPIGWSYMVRTTLPSSVDGVQFRLDGEVVQHYDLTAPPEVTVTSPNAATVVARGKTLTVSWTTKLPVGAGSTATVIASQDGGTTWKPLAVEVTGTTTDIVVPRDMVDATTVVRVIVQDGMVAGQADSEPFVVNAPVSVVDEKVVAVRHDLVDLTAAGSTLPAQPGKGLYTMDVDGTDFNEIVPMVPPTNGVGGMVPLHPDWRRDAAAIAFDGEVSGRRDLYVVNPDGTNRRRITDESSREGDQFVCADWHPDGRHLLSMATTGFGGQAWLQLVKVDTITGVVEDVRGWGHSNVFFPAWDLACPRWSDDGGEILFSSEMRASRSGLDVDIFVIDVATLQSKYQGPVLAATIESVQHSTWLNFAPGDDDRFLATQRLFSTGSLAVAELRPKVYIVNEPITIDVPTLVWGTSSIEPVRQADQKFGSAGFTADGENIWFTSTNLMFPTRTRQLEQYNFSFWYGITTRSVGHLCRMAVGGTTATCYLPGPTGEPVEIDDGYVREPDVPLPAPTVGVIQADVHPGFTRLDTSPPIVVEDPATLPSDPEEPPPSDVDTPAPESGPAPGADATPPVAAPEPEAVTYSVPAGSTTSIVLRDESGQPAPARITGRPDDGTADLAAANPKGGDADTTGPDAAVLVTPAAGFTGRFTFEVTPPTGFPVVITVEVVGPNAPTAVDDTLTVATAGRLVIDASALLANDTPPAERSSSAVFSRAAALVGLELVSVYGYTGGRATLLGDGTIDLQTTNSQGGSFDYVVGVPGSTGISTGRVNVVVAAAQPSATTAPSTTVAQSSSSTVPTMTVPTTVPATFPPSVTPPADPPATPAAGTPSDELPATGQDSLGLLQSGAALTALGLCILLLSRKWRGRTWQLDGDSRSGVGQSRRTP